MITQKEIKEALNKQIKMKFPDYRIYGIEVTEGYKKPSFFVDLRLIAREDLSVSTVNWAYSVSIIYFQKVVNENDNMEKIAGIIECLSNKDYKNKKRKMLLKVRERYLPISGFETGYIGRNNNILQIDFELRFMEFINHEEASDIMEKLIMNQETEE